MSEGSVERFHQLVNGWTDVSEGGSNHGGVKMKVKPNPEAPDCRIKISPPFLDDEDMSRELLDSDCTHHQIDCWFGMTPRQHWITCLADIIGKWGDEDLSVLRLTDRGLSQKDITDLLGRHPHTYCDGKVTDMDLSVIHLLVSNNQTSTFISLLDQVTSRQNLLPLIQLRGRYGLNGLSRAVMHVRSDIYRYLVRRLGEDESFTLLCERGECGCTGLHEAFRWNDSVAKVLSLLNGEARIHHPLSIKDELGRTVLSYSIDWKTEGKFQSIIRHYAGKPSDLLKLAELTDNRGNTSFHYAAGQKTSNFLTNLIKSTYSLDTRENLAHVLSKRNVSGRKKMLGWEDKKCHPDNELIHDWAFDSLINNRYLLFDYPSVLVLYNVPTREDGARTEARSLIKCLKEVGFNVKHSDSFTKDQLFEALEGCQGMTASRNGQIVALMSHGSEGFIRDSEDALIPITEIEERMCADTHSNTPKLLILQCCQGNSTEVRINDNPKISEAPASNSTEVQPKVSPKINDNAPSSHNSTDANAPAYSRIYRSYSPRHADFCALVSTGPGTVSERNEFIPRLAEAITAMRPEANIGELMGTVKRQFPVNVPEQAPGCNDWLKFDLCLKNILPIYLKSKRKRELEQPMGQPNQHGKSRKLWNNPTNQALK